MLILFRRPGDAILIEGGIRVVVVAVDRGGVRIGIEAPSDVSIVRQELATQVADENRRASALSNANAMLQAMKPARRGTIPHR
jgi:carbon storage regulator